jgi:hypothetical protein
MLGLSRYEVASSSSSTDRAYEYGLRCPGNKANQPEKQLPSHLLVNYPERWYWMRTDKEAQDWVALWKSTRWIGVWCDYSFKSVEERL